MSDRTDQNDSTEVISTHQNTPALIATFYGHRGRLRPLYARLYEAMGGTPGSDPPADWEGPNGEGFLRSFDPPAAHDSTVVQVAFNAPGPIAQVWSILQERLFAVIDGQLMQAVWGYTLLYQAAIAEVGDISKTLLTSLTAIGPIGETLRLETHLATTNPSGGQLWLLNVPLDADGLAAGTVYVALGPMELEDDFVRDVLYGPGASLLMPDLIAHKGYHQIRQYRMGELENRYTDDVADVRDSAGRVLGNLELHDGKTDELALLAQAYFKLNQVTSILGSLKISMQRQLHNYDHWRDNRHVNDVLEFHRDHFETAIVELELLLAEGRDALELAGSVVDMAQVRVDKAQERRQLRMGTLFTVIAVALTVPTVIDPPVASELLQLGGASPPDQGFSALLLLGVRSAITLILVGIALMTLRVMDSKK